ncbi:MAG: class I SAM-dependent methyltransferase [Myxococcota bacterium]
MTKDQNEKPNGQQIEYWNNNAGPTWVESQENMDRMLAPVTNALLGRCAVVPDERVLDVGCGCGDTSIQLGQAGAAVWGIDISEPMLGRAKERAKSQGLSQVAFGQTDAATQALTPDHDLIVSRFGVMFFDDPEAAFRNLRSGLSPNGRLCFICWQPMVKNPWITTAGQAVAPFLAPPENPPDPHAPGPFALADADRLRGILAQAGFAEIEIDSTELTLHLADTIEEAMEMQTRIGPVARAINELEGEVRDQALAAARDALESKMTAGGLNLGAACWLVHAKAG